MAHDAAGSVQVTSFRVGHCTHPACMVLKGAGLASLCFPSRAFLIHTRVGWVLWDTGYANHFHDATAHGVFRLYPWVTPVTFEPKHALAAQLRAYGLAPRDIHTLVLSHFHADHVAGLRDFPHARLRCSAEGWNAVRGLQGLGAVRRGFVPGLMPPDMEARLQFVDASPAVALPAALHPFTHARDVLGTGELLVVDLPGHVQGHVGAFVATDNGWVLLASDAAWMPEGYQQLRGPSELTFVVQHQRAAYYRTLRQLHTLHQSGHAAILLTHESHTAFDAPPSPLP